MATKWGSAGCGMIGADFFNALRAFPKEEHVLVAAAARDLNKAKKFASNFGAEKAYDSYQQLADDREVEVVYINVINTKHFELVEMYLKAGKSVLCEKPLGLNERQTKQMVNLARQKKLFFMEAIWSRCTPVYKEVKRRIQAGEIGEVEQVVVAFGFPLAERVLNKALGGSATLDIGIYIIQFALHAFGAQKPEEIVATGVLNETGVDDKMSVTLKFKNGKVATLCCNATCELPNEAFICGSKGMIKVPFPFWAPLSFDSPSGTFNTKLPEIEGSKFNYHNSQALMYEAQEVRECILKGKTESSYLPLQESVLIAEILGEIHKQLGVDYSHV